MASIVGKPVVFGIQTESVEFGATVAVIVWENQDVEKTHQPYEIIGPSGDLIGLCFYRGGEQISFGCIPSHATLLSGARTGNILPEPGTKMALKTTSSVTTDPDIDFTGVGKLYTVMSARKTRTPTAPVVWQITALHSDGISNYDPIVT